jgi:enoyl-CoA hydratase/carnithine racemase
MGTARANQVLLNGRKFSGSEAKSWGFATDSFATLKEAHEAAFTTAKTLAESSENAILQSKSLIRSEDEIDKLMKVGRLEAQRLHDCWLHPDLFTAVMKFMSRPKAKL